MYFAKFSGGADINNPFVATLSKMDTQADVVGRAEQISLFSLLNGWEAEPGGDRDGFVWIHEEELPEDF